MACDALLDILNVESNEYGIRFRGEDDDMAIIQSMLDEIKSSWDSLHKIYHAVLIEKTRWIRQRQCIKVKVAEGFNGGDIDVNDDGDGDIGNGDNFAVDQNINGTDYGDGDGNGDGNGDGYSEG